MDDKMFDLMTKMYNEMQDIRTDITGINTDITGIKTDIAGIKTDITKIVVGQEKMQTDIDIIAEVQKSHTVENERHHGEIVEMLTNRVDIAELAIRKISAAK